jgi:hypothetical protein
MLKKFFFLLLLVVFAIIVFAVYLGVFNEIKMEEKQEGGYVIAGYDVLGPYSMAGKSMSDVDVKVRNAGLQLTMGLGIYYDDPKVVPPQKCRSFIGFILDKQSLNKITDLKTAGLKVDTILPASSVVAEFPLKNNLSYMIGPMKVYPVFSTYMNQKRYKPALSFEIYDKLHDKIVFVMQYE